MNIVILFKVSLKISYGNYYKRACVIDTFDMYRDSFIFFTWNWEVYKDDKIISKSYQVSVPLE